MKLISGFIQSLDLAKWMKWNIQDHRIAVQWMLWWVYFCRLKVSKWQMALCNSSKKTDAKVNLWVTTGDGRNRSTWYKRLSFCKSNPSHAATSSIVALLSDYEYFMASIWHHAQKDISRFFSNRNPGVRECHRGVKSVYGPQAKDRIYDALVDDIRWIFSFLSGEPVCPPQLINHWTVHSLSSLLERSVSAFCWVEEWFQSAQSTSCVLTNCDRFPHLISVELEWLSGGGNLLGLAVS